MRGVYTRGRRLVLEAIEGDQEGLGHQLNQCREPRYGNFLQKCAEKQIDRDDNSASEQIANQVFWRHWLKLNAVNLFDITSLFKLLDLDFH